MAKLIDPMTVLSTELVAAIFSDLDVKTVLSARKSWRKLLADGLIIDEVLKDWTSYCDPPLFSEIVEQARRYAQLEEQVKKLPVSPTGSDKLEAMLRFQHSKPAKVLTLENIGGPGTYGRSLTVQGHMAIVGIELDLDMSQISHFMTGDATAHFAAAGLECQFKPPGMTLAVNLFSGEITNLGDFESLPTNHSTLFAYDMSSSMLGAGKAACYNLSKKSIHSIEDPALKDWKPKVCFEDWVIFQSMKPVSMMARRMRFLIWSTRDGRWCTYELDMASILPLERGRVDDLLQAYLDHDDESSTLYLTISTWFEPRCYTEILTLKMPFDTSDWSTELGGCKRILTPSNSLKELSEEDWQVLIPSNDKKKEDSSNRENTYAFVRGHRLNERHEDAVRNGRMYDGKGKFALGFGDDEVFYDPMTGEITGDIGMYPRGQEIFKGDRDTCALWRGVRYEVESEPQLRITCSHDSAARPDRKRATRPVRITAPLTKNQKKKQSHARAKKAKAGGGAAATPTKKFINEEAAAKCFIAGNDRYMCALTHESFIVMFFDPGMEDHMPDWGFGEYDNRNPLIDAIFDFGEEGEGDWEDGSDISID